MAIRPSLGKTASAQAYVPAPRRSTYLRLSLTSACNLHCRYCRPEGESASDAWGYGCSPLSDERLLHLLSTLHEAVPLRKLRLTGGEPLLRPGLPGLAASLRARFPETELCLTTNGLLLEERAALLFQSGVQRLNVSLDTLDPGLFQKLAGRPGLPRVLDGLDAARSAGFASVKINAVLLRSYNLESLPDLVRLAAEKGCEIRFVELMPFGAGAALFRKEFYPAALALDRLLSAFPYAGPLPPSDTADRHGFEVDGVEVPVGFITPVSSRFCDRCDRLRLDSSGRLFACLRDEEGVDLAALYARGGRPAVVRAVRKVLLLKGKPAGRWPRRVMAHLGG